MSLSKFNIIKGRKSDIEDIVQFQIDMAMESEGIELDREIVTNGVTAAMDDESKGQYWIAQAEGKVIGSLMITREWSDWNNEWYWWIQSVYVHPAYRNQGVYKAMYATIKDKAHKSNVSQIRLYADKTNYSAQQVYHRLGMKESHYLIFEVSV